MHGPHALLASAAALTLTALLSVTTKPAPRVLPPPPPALASSGPLRLEVRPSHGAWASSGEQFAEVTVTLDEEPLSAALPVSMALVLDSSGSMAGEKLEQARRAAHRLVDLLAERDELGLVTFGTEVVEAPRRRMDGAGKRALHAAIDGVAATGSTNLSAGVEAGHRQLRDAPGARRLVLVSDGRPTVGLTDEASLLRLVTQTREAAVTVTALGVGADYDGVLMQRLAERGGGMYGYLQSAATLEEVLGQEVTAARTARVRNVELVLSADQLQLLDAPGRVAVRRNDAGLTLYLADLRPKQETRVYVRFRGSALRVEDQVATLRASASWRRVGGEAGPPLQATLRLPGVEDQVALRASRDEAVFTRAIQAVGSEQLVAAAAAYERGDEAGALHLLGNARALFGMSADALAGEAEVERVRATFDAADGEQRKHLARDLEKKKLTSFGRLMEGY